MSTLWFCLVALMLAAYVLFDGFDLGVGALHLGVARNDAERRTVLTTSGRCGMATKYGFSQRAARSTLRFPRSTHPGSAVSICRS